MSFTYSQCRRFKEWGYPQDNGDKKFVTSKGSYAIPTLDGVMEWLKSLTVEGAEIELSYQPYMLDENPEYHWKSSILQPEDEEGFKTYSPVGYGHAAHAALYNLAEKVKGEK